jgi:hypothetical protein
MNMRPVSISHLVFGLIFLGATVLWVIGAATDADAPDLAAVAPAVLIGAGVIGLAATVFNARNARVHARARARAVDATTESDIAQPGYADTGATDHEEQQ